MSAPTTPLPRWADYGLLPLINLVMALIASGLIILAVGENPLEAVQFMLIGAFGYAEGLGYTLYYTTNFVFTGLAVAVAFHAGLFNIGGEGQAYLGGLGAGLIILALDRYLPGWLLIPLAMLFACLFGAAWASVPAYLQAYRGSHIVITTIMFNFIATALMVYLLVNVLIEPGSMVPRSREFADSASIPHWHEVLAWFGIATAQTPLNLSALLALAAALFVWIYVWHTRWGYTLRTVGFNEQAAKYAGVDPRRVIMVTMGLSGGLAGMVGINEVMGVQHNLLLNFVAGYGFTGIAVALMGRNHPVGIILASLLFGVLYQGGAELSFEMPTMTRDMVVTIQGLVILFSGALSYMARPWLEKAFALLSRPRGAAATEAA